MKIRRIAIMLDTINQIKLIEKLKLETL